MKGIFYGCKSLKKLPDISKWNTFNVNDISWMFYGCESLKTLLIYQNGTQIIYLI